MKNHKFEELGSLASPCLQCDAPFALTRNHRGWVGIPCPTLHYSSRAIQNITNLYMEFKFEAVIVHSPAINA